MQECEQAVWLALELERNPDFTLDLNAYPTSVVLAVLAGSAPVTL